MPVTAKIGDSTSRIDGVDKVTGAARYAAEYFFDGMLYGWIVSSAIAKGCIASIDETAARAVTGVVDIITHQNRPHLPLFDASYGDDVGPPGSPFRALYDDKIAFSQQPLALVLADTLEAARHAASLVVVGYQASHHNTDFDIALAEKFDPKKKRFGYKAPKARGDADEALARAAVRCDATYRIGVHHHNSMEMHASTVKWNDDGSIDVYDKTQGAQNVQAYLAGVFGLSKKRCVSSTRMWAVRSARACGRSTRCIWRPWPQRCSSARYGWS